MKTPSGLRQDLALHCPELHRLHDLCDIQRQGQMGFRDARVHPSLRTPPATGVRYRVSALRSKRSRSSPFQEIPQCHRRQSTSPLAQQQNLSLPPKVFHSLLDPSKSKAFTVLCLFDSLMGPSMAHFAFIVDQRFTACTDARAED